MVGVITLGFFGFGLDHSLDTIKHLAGFPANMLIVGEASALSTTRAFGQRPEYLERGVFDDSWGINRVRIMAIRVVKVTRMIKYATKAGITLPEEYKLTVTGGRIKPREQKAFVKGVWRDKEQKLFNRNL